MDQLLEFVTAYKIPLTVVGVIVVLAYDKIIPLLSKLKNSVNLGFLKSKNSVESEDVIEDEDQKALRHLRNRALESEDQELMDLIRKIDSRFYDIHIGLKK